MSEKIYFAYGSNINLEQMAFRCPAAEPIGPASVDGFRLTFCGDTSGAGVATILPDKGSQVNGLLWLLTENCESSLDFYEGFPRLYGKEEISVHGERIAEQSVMVYTINEPYRSQIALPSWPYLNGILQGCQQNGIPVEPVLEAVESIQRQQLRQRPKPPRGPVR